MQNPIDDLTYDWVTLLHEKGKALNAFKKYINDAKEVDSQECVDLLEELQEQETQSAEKVRTHVAKFLQQELRQFDSSESQPETTLTGH